MKNIIASLIVFGFAVAMVSCGAKKEEAVAATVDSVATVIDSAVEVVDSVVVDSAAVAN
ncbi:MAG: hypothetical protein JNL53_16360 [Cyclobacteriaceae bacterium]|nr:hypothetical protein [Cyclobacteriaceae bacterium]